MTDDTPRDPLADVLMEIDASRRHGDYPHLGSEGDITRLVTDLRAAGVTLDARPSGDDEALRAALLEASEHECWDGDNFIARPLTHLAALAAPVSRPSGDDEALRANTGNDPRFKWYRRTEDDATLFGRLIGLADSAVLDAASGAHEHRLRARLRGVVESWALDDTCLRNEVDRFLDDVLAALAAPVSPSPDVETPHA